MADDNLTDLHALRLGHSLENKQDNYELQVIVQWVSLKRKSHHFRVPPCTQQCLKIALDTG